MYQVYVCVGGWARTVKRNFEAVTLLCKATRTNTVGFPTNAFYQCLLQELVAPMSGE